MGEKLSGKCTRRFSNELLGHSCQSVVLHCFRRNNHRQRADRLRHTFKDVLVLVLLPLSCPVLCAISLHFAESSFQKDTEEGNCEKKQTLFLCGSLLRLRLLLLLCWSCARSSYGSRRTLRIVIVVVLKKRFTSCFTHTVELLLSGSIKRIIYIF